MYSAVFLLSIIAIVMIIGIPATLSLPKGKRPGLEDQNITQTAHQLKNSGKTGWDLVAAATLLVHDRMQYCRRNSFDHCSKAFERGYGYCQQQAYALKTLLELLDFEAKVVHSLKNKFPDGKTGSHAWVEVTINEEMRNYCSVLPDPLTALPQFTILGKVYRYNQVFRVFAGWGAIGVNAIHYYIKKGK